MTSQRCALGCLVLLGSAMLGLLLWTAISILHTIWPRPCNAVWTF
jgi:hypothetical protein